MPHKVLYAFANKDQILKSENTRRGVVESHTRRHSLSYETEETSQSHIEKKWSDSNDSRDSGVDLMTPVATMDSPPELIKSKKSMSHESVFQGYTLPPEFTQIETQSQARLCDPYTFPLDVSFGHVDVLAGSKAEVMWEQIRVWLCEDARRRQRSV